MNPSMMRTSLEAEWSVSIGLYFSKNVWISVTWWIRFLWSKVYVDESKGSAGSHSGED